MSRFPYLSLEAAAIAVQLRSNVAVRPPQLAAFLDFLTPASRHGGGSGGPGGPEQLQGPSEPSEDEMGVEACHKLGMQDWLSGR